MHFKIILAESWNASPNKQNGRQISSESERKRRRKKYASLVVLDFTWDATRAVKWSENENVRLDFGVY